MSEIRRPASLDLNRRHLHWAIKIQEEIAAGNRAVIEAREREIAARESRVRERMARSRESKPLVRVTHPRYGEVVVHAGSCFDGQLAAAEAWGVDWMEIRDCRVWRHQEEGS